MSIKWHKQLNHGKMLPLNVATISKYGIHFGSEFVKNYKICFNKGAHSHGCSVACRSFIRDLPFDIYNTLMHVEVNVLAGMIFELKFMKEE